VLHDISCSLRPHECLAIVGGSGSGKTTLARCIVGLHSPWSGEVRLRGQTLATTARARSAASLRAIQYIFQNPYGSLNPRKRVHEILDQPIRQLSSLTRRERQRRIIGALGGAALGREFLRATPGELSGGERQRVAIARALVVEPEILVCDEITSALDVSVQAAIVETLKRLRADNGLAIVFITHNLALVRSIAQRIIVMNDGEVVEASDVHTVLEHPQASYTQQLLHDIPRSYSLDASESVSPLMSSGPA
jgi:peptide/nickel transport system ATP-binding protein